MSENTKQWIFEIVFVLTVTVGLFSGFAFANLLTGYKVGLAYVMYMIVGDVIYFWACYILFCRWCDRRERK